MSKQLIKGKAARKRYYDKHYIADHSDYFSEELSLSEVQALIGWLGYKPKNVCDVACGNGRHLLAFSKIGVNEGVGIDASKELLKIAKNDLKQTNFKLVHSTFADWRPEPEKFDITYSLFSALGYCLENSKAQDLVDKMVLTTKNGGFVCIDTDNVFRMIHYLDEKSKKNRNSSEKLNFDAATMILSSRDVKKDETLEEKMRYYTAPELKSMFLHSGHTGTINFYGDFENNPYKSSSKRLIVVMKKRNI